MDGNIERDGPWLVVLAGRFLPVYSITISTEVDSQPIYGVGSSTPSGYIQKSKFASGELVTDRAPMLESFPEKHTTLRLYNSDTVYVFWQLALNISRSDISAERYLINFVADSYDIGQR